MTTRELIQSFDWVLYISAILLVSLGLAMLFSASPDNEISSRFTTQLVALTIGTVLGVLVARIPYHVLRRHTILIYAGGVAALVIVAMLAPVIRGTASRFAILGFQIQPSEFMKVALVVALAWIIGRLMPVNWRTVALSAIAVLLPATLVFLEPDTGTAFLMVALWASLLFFAGLSWRWVFTISVGGVLFFIVAWFWLFADYQRARLTTFVDPWSDPLGAGYNVVQSMIAIGSGQTTGRGLGQGTQSHLQFLPEQHTDFMMASIGEELGLIGIILILVLYGILLWRIARAARSTPDPFARLLATGAFFLLLFSFFVSAGMNMGLLPVTGIPLPLVSYGGSNLVATFLLLGLVESVIIYSRWVAGPPPEIDHF